MQVILKAEDDIYGFYEDNELIFEDQLDTMDFLEVQEELGFLGITPQILNNDDQGIYYVWDEFPEELAKLTGNYVGIEYGEDYIADYKTNVTVRDSSTGGTSIMNMGTTTIAQHGTLNLPNSTTNTVTYDVKDVPSGWDIAQLMDTFQRTGILFTDKTVMANQGSISLLNDEEENEYLYDGTIREEEKVISPLAPIR